MTQIGLAACSLSLVAPRRSTGPPPLAALFAVAFVAAGLAAVDQPARSRRSRGWSRRSACPSAIALNQLNFQAASIVGPAIGGLLIATVGLAGAYAVDVITFVASLAALLRHPAAAAARGRTRPGSRRRSARACASPGAAGAILARSSSTSTR